ncbi:hypothetical protein, partial [Pseudomonas sp. 165]|uniref:hypothetical protein n=1 Tax=Pseudomonas sp. 165 TaxID=2746722 RepID=UPI0025763615
MAYFPELPTIQEQLHSLQQQIGEEREMQLDLERELSNRRHKRDDHDIVRRAINATIRVQSSRKDSKISRKAFTFQNYDGRKDAEVLLAWLSQLNDYFAGEKYTGKDKNKCAANHMVDSAALWWSVIKQGRDKPDSWKRFQRVVKKHFLPSQFKSKVRHQWDTL